MKDKLNEVAEIWVLILRDCKTDTITGCQALRSSFNVDSTISSLGRTVQIPTFAQAAPSTLTTSPPRPGTGSPPSESEPGRRNLAFPLGVVFDAIVATGIVVAALVAIGRQQRLQRSAQAVDRSEMHSVRA